MEIGGRKGLLQSGGLRDKLPKEDCLSIIIKALTVVLMNWEWARKIVVPPCNKDCLQGGQATNVELLKEKPNSKNTGQAMLDWLNLWGVVV